VFPGPCGPFPGKCQSCSVVWHGMARMATRKKIVPSTGLMNTSIDGSHGRQDFWIGHPSIETGHCKSRLVVGEYLRAGQHSLPSPFAVHDLSFVHHAIRLGLAKLPDHQTTAAPLEVMRKYADVVILRDCLVDTLTRSCTGNGDR